MAIKTITPNWQVPSNVKSCVTTRADGVSQPPYQSFNLAAHVGDKLSDVTQNRALLMETLQLPSMPVWLEQQHTTIVFNAEKWISVPPLADASITTTPGVVLAVMTADCLPILICNQEGTEIAAIHGGWKGLFDGVIANTVQAMHSTPQSLMAWFGPCIQQPSYQVDAAFREQCLQKNPRFSRAFTPDTQAGFYRFSLTQVATIQLHDLDVTKISDSGQCTYQEESLFFSYRRDNATGRQASLIWLNS